MAARKARSVAVEDPQGGLDRGEGVRLAQGRELLVGLVGVDRRRLDERGAAQARLGRDVLGLLLTAPAARAALGDGGPGGEDEDVVRVLPRVVAEEVPAVIGAERPGELELDEPVQPVDQSSAADFLAVRSANFDGPVRTTGSSISLRRSTSLIHCLGLSVALTCLAWRAFVP